MACVAEVMSRGRACAWPAGAHAGCCCNPVPVQHRFASGQPCKPLSLAPGVCSFLHTVTMATPLAQCALHAALYSTTMQESAAPDGAMLLAPHVRGMQLLCWSRPNVVDIDTTQRVTFLAHALAATPLNFSKMDTDQVTVLLLAHCAVMLAAHA